MSLEEVVQVSLTDILDAQTHEEYTQFSIPKDSDIRALSELVDQAQTQLDVIESDSLQFQNDIQQLAEEMKQLQKQSTNLHKKLQVRQKVLEKVSPIVDSRVIPPAIVREICEGEIGPQWRAAMAFVARHVEEHDSDFGRDLLEKTAVRAKDFYIRRIRRLRRAGIDAQEVEDELINNSGLFQHLKATNSDVADTISQGYVNTMKWYYTMLLGKYLRFIGRQPVNVSDSSKTVGEVVFSSGRSFWSSAAVDNSSFFILGARSSILSDGLNAIPWTSPAAPQPFRVEQLVKTVMVVLHDNIQSEAKVLSEAFCMEDEQANSCLKDLFSSHLDHSGQIFSKMWSTFDVYDLLLSSKLMDNFRNVPLLSEFIEAQEKKIWAQIQTVLETNAKSIEAAAAKPSTSRNVPNEPHKLTQVVASLLTGILQLAKKADPVVPAIRQLINVYESFITKLSKSSATPELFLYNNYFVLSALLGDSDNELGSELSEHFKLLTDAYSPK